MLLIVDLLATLLVALEGGSAAILGHLDIFGVLVLAFVSSVGGGMIRDLLIGAVPPNAIRDWRYAATALGGGLCLLFGFHAFTEMPTELLVALDAAGLALFAVAGADKALEFGIHPLPAVLMAAITGCGGGVIRDLLLARVPNLLRADVYATAALAGGAVAVLLIRAGVPRVWAMSAGAVFCFALRMVAVAHHWQLPHLMP